MALHTGSESGSGSGFARMAAMASQIEAAIKSLPAQPKHINHVSKKKEARRQRQEEARRLAELHDATSTEIVFALPELTPPDASKAKHDLEELEREMRTLLGLDKPDPVVVAPIPVAKPITKPKTLAKRKPKPSPFVTTSPPPPVKAAAKPVKQAVKRQLEVLLQVLRPDGIEVPFYHCDTGISELVAELNAARKARGYGLQVLSTISITTQEYACHT